MGKVSVQMTLRIEPAEYKQFEQAAGEAGLSVPMWLIQCGRARVEENGDHG